MTQAIFYALLGGILFIMGLRTLLVAPHLVRKVLAANIMGSGVFLILIALADREGGAAPDPVPHAMVLTGIVVSISATTVALNLICRLKAETGREDLQETDDR